MDLKSINLGINHIPFLSYQMNKQTLELKTNYSNEDNAVMKRVSWIELLDSGACRSCVSKDFMDKCRIPNEKQQATILGFLQRQIDKLQILKNKLKSQLI